MPSLALVSEILLWTNLSVAAWCIKWPNMTLPWCGMLWWSWKHLWASRQGEVILMQLVSNLRISKRIPSELERPTMSSAVSYLKGKEKMYRYKRRGFTRLKEGTEIYREKDEVRDQKLLSQSSSAQSYNPWNDTTYPIFFSTYLNLSILLVTYQAMPWFSNAKL